MDVVDVVDVAGGCVGGMCVAGYFNAGFRYCFVKISLIIYDNI